MCGAEHALPHVPPAVEALERRVAELERRLAELERLVAELKKARGG